MNPLSPTLLGAFIVGAFLLGSIPFALLIGLAKGTDIRAVGSKNPGATNLGRTFGFKWFLLCFALDAAKGLAPTLAFGLLTDLASAPGMTPTSAFAPGLFEGKRALVTGGGTGIGLAITSELLRLGATVLIASRSEEKLSAARASLSAHAGRLHTFATNVRKEEEIVALVEHAKVHAPAGGERQGRRRHARLGGGGAQDGRRALGQH